MIIKHNRGFLNYSNLPFRSTWNPTHGCIPLLKFQSIFHSETTVFYSLTHSLTLICFSDYLRSLLSFLKLPCPSWFTPFLFHPRPHDLSSLSFIHYYPRYYHHGHLATCVTVSLPGLLSSTKVDHTDLQITTTVDPWSYHLVNSNSVLTIP